VAYRRATEDVELGGVQIAHGEHMLLLIGSANRDAERFADPERLDLTRQPNPHLSYSAGTHYCLGAWLARIECQIALRSLFTRFPDMRLGSGPIQFRPDILLRGLENLPVVFG
jgi:cytochrome P450